MFPFFESEGRGLNSLRARCSTSPTRLEILSSDARSLDRFSGSWNQDGINGEEFAATLSARRSSFGGSGSTTRGAIALTPALRSPTSR